MSRAKLRLLIVDDSAYNRALLSSVFDKLPEVEVVGRAADGEEALRLANVRQPDVITLDLEMPKMDGFTFLRLQLARRAVPVIVVSSYAQRENVFRALELGAYDFVAKTASQIGESERELLGTIRDKVLSVGALEPGAWAKRGMKIPPPQESRRTLPSGPSGQAATRTACVIASTGGPASLLQLAAKLPASSRGALLVAQHMPEKFTRTFAERLAKKGEWSFAEALGGMPVQAGCGVIAPGGKCIELTWPQQRLPVAPRLAVAVHEPRQSDRFVPSGDRLFASAASLLGEQAIGVVLSGMGDDGLLGARAIRERGGVVLVESPASAACAPMPRAVAEAGLASEVLPLEALTERLIALLA